MKSGIELKRLGTVAADIVEANPAVFGGRLYRFEYIRESNAGNTTGSSFFRFIDVASGRSTASFGRGLHMGCAFVSDGRMYVSCVRKWGGSEVLLLWSDDLLNWSEPEIILSAPGWEVFNTSICRSADGFTMVFERGRPAPGDVNFTMYFAYSSDLHDWRVIPGAVYGFGVYCGAPLLRYFDKWYYFFHLSGSYESGFNTMVSRSKDLKDWSREELVLPYDEADRRWLVPVNAELLERSRRARNINASDLDFCEYGGKLYATYSWGDQRGDEYLALGEADCGEREFCESFFAIR